MLVDVEDDGTNAITEEAPRVAKAVAERTERDFIAVLFFGRKKMTDGKSIVFHNYWTNEYLFIWMSLP